MLYVIFSKDYPNSLQARRQARPAHLARLQALHNQGRLVLAGPLPKVDAADMPEQGFCGSLIVVEFASLAEAQAWAEEDPYLAAGVYKKVDVYPFVQVFPQALA